MNKPRYNHILMSTCKCSPTPKLLNNDVNKSLILAKLVALNSDQNNVTRVKVFAILKASINTLSIFPLCSFLGIWLRMIFSMI